MAKLYFRYGAMGSSKTANAIMVQYNYQERGQNALMLKPRLDNRDGARVVGSRSGLTAPCRFVEEMDQLDLSAYNCIIVDEAQFLTKAHVQRLVDIVDDMDIPVICYGLRADFQGNLFEGSHWLMAWADTIEEIKTVCWCGRKATTNARLMDGKVVKSGAQIVLGGNESYVALCRKHWAKGELAPEEIRRISAGKEAYMPLLMEADPSEDMIRKYLDEGEFYALMLRGTPVAVAVVVPWGGGAYELRNLAVEASHRGQGYGSKMVRYLMKQLAGRADRLVVGTSPANVGFYERLGFVREVAIPHFFRDNYPEPIIEDGAPLDDMITLSARLA
ncbi:MAG: thymidine kinase [Clostridia bacterium]|nr:thymidine kinase [Clostridia bacterium]